MTTRVLACGDVWQTTSPGHMEVLKVPLVDPTVGEALVEVIGMGICGTDIHGFKGLFGKFPMVLGHDGEVDWNGKRATIDPAITCGVCPECHNDRRYACPDYHFLGINCDGLFATHLLVPLRALHLLPDDFPPLAATALEPVAVGLRLLDRLRHQLSSRPSVTIIGGGPMGLVIGKLLSIAECEVTIIEPHRNRRELGEAWGQKAQVQSFYKDRIYIETSSNDGATEELVKRAPPGSTIAMIGAPRTQISMREVVLRDLSIIGVRGGAGRYPAAIKLVAAGVVPVAQLVTHTFATPDEAIRAASTKPDEIIRAGVIRR